MLSVRRIQDRALFTNYAHRRAQLLAKYSDSLSFTAGNEWLQRPGKGVLTDAVLDQLQLQGSGGGGLGSLDRRVNEKLLFHGTGNS